MIKYWSCHEKLTKTVRLLAILDKKLKQRLVDAYIDQLHYVDSRSMPPHLKNDLIKIHNQLTRNNTKPIAEVIRHWKKTKVMNITDNIFALYERLSYYYHSDGKT